MALKRCGWAVMLALVAAGVEPARGGDWLGYMGVFDKTPSGGQGGYVFGSPWGVSALKTNVINGSGTGATIVNNTLDLYPNYNTYTENPNNAFWRDNGGAGPGGNKWMEANTYVEPQRVITAPSWTFSGTVPSYTLSSAYSAKAFIKVLDPLTGYSTSLISTQDLSGQTTFSLTEDLSFYQGQLLQVGFLVSGVNANPVNTAALGSVRVITYPQTSITINVASGTQTQAQAGYPAISGSLPLSKTGAGTLVFNAANPYTGATSIDAGTLRVTSTAGLTASPVTVKAAAALAVAATGTTGMTGVTVEQGGAMTLRNDAAQTMNLQSLTLKPVAGLTIDSGSMTYGYMNVFDLPANGGAFQPGVSGPWGVPDLRANFTSGSSVTLAPCFVSDTSSYWYTPSGQPGASGNKIMEANVYGQADGTYAGQNVKFSGSVASYSLLSGSGNYAVKAFVRDFTADYSSFNEQTVPVTGTGAFSVSLNVSSDPTHHVQWGLQTTGPNVWVTDLPAKGTVVVNATPTEWGKIDVGNGMVNVASGLSAADMVAALIVGRNDGTWTGTAGITSSAAAANVASGTPRTVGWLDNGGGSVTFAYAAPGDTNLDWQIDILDAADFVGGSKFDTGEPASWEQGDFTYDGIVDVLDAAAFVATGLFDAGPYNTPAGVAGTIAPVPEPSTWALVAAGGLGGACLCGRRRKGGIGPRSAG
jgi:autotransporter-associated beta strand protein